MDQQTLQILKRNLVSKGYSKRYADRLIGELTDHILSELSDRNQPVRDIEAHIGRLDDLVDVVSSFRDLDPIPRKYPVVVFLLAPAFAVTVLTLLMLNWIHGWLPQHANAEKMNAIGLWGCVEYSLLFGLPTSGVWVANRYKVSINYVVLGCLFLSFAGLFLTTAAACNQSGSTFVHSRWEFNWIRLGLPWLPLMFAAVVRRIRVSVNCQASQLTTFTLPELKEYLTPRNALLLTALIVSGTAYNYSVSHTLDDLRRHPIDNLIAGFNKPEMFAYRYLQACRQYIKEPGLEAKFVFSVAARFEHYDLEMASHRSQSLAGEESREGHKKQRLDWQELVVEAHEEISSYFSAEQNDEITKLARLQSGWQAMFFPSVREYIGLSAYQYREFKDEYLAAIKINQRMMSQWKKADSKERELVAARIALSRQSRDQKLAAVLSQKQVQRFDEYCGSKKSQTLGLISKSNRYRTSKAKKRQP